MAGINKDSNVKQGQGRSGGGGMEEILNIIDQANMICSINDHDHRIGDHEHSQDRWPVSTRARAPYASSDAAKEVEEDRKFNNDNQNNVNFDIDFSERFKSSLKFNADSSDWDDEDDREDVPPPPPPLPPPPGALQLSSSYASHDSSSSCSSFLASSSYAGTSSAGSYAFQTPPTVTKTTINKNLVLTTPPPLHLPPPFHQHRQIEVQNHDNTKMMQPVGGHGSCCDDNNKINFMNDTTPEASGCRSMDEEDNSNCTSEEQKEEQEQQEQSASTGAGESNRTQSRPVVWPSLLHSSTTRRKRTRNAPSNTASTAGAAAATNEKEKDPEMMTWKSKFPILSSDTRRGAPPAVPLLPGTPEFDFGRKHTLTATSVTAEAVKVIRGSQQQKRQQQKEDGDVVMAQRLVVPPPPPPALGIETGPRPYNPFMNHLPIHSPIGGYSVAKPSNFEFYKKFQQQQQYGSGDCNNNSAKAATTSMQVSCKSDSTPSPSDRALKRALLRSHTRRLSSYSSSMAIPILEDEEEVNDQGAGSQIKASTITLLPHSTSLMSRPPSPLRPPPPPMNLHVDVGSHNMARTATIKATTSLMPRTSSFGASMDALSPPAPLSRLRRRDGMEQRSGF